METGRGRQRAARSDCGGARTNRAGKVQEEEEEEEEGECAVKRRKHWNPTSTVRGRRRRRAVTSALTNSPNLKELRKAVQM